MPRYNKFVTGLQKESQGDDVKFGDSETDIASFVKTKIWPLSIDKTARQYWQHQFDNRTYDIYRGLGKRLLS